MPPTEDNNKPRTLLGSHQWLLRFLPGYMFILQLHRIADGSLVLIVALGKGEVTHVSFIRDPVRVNDELR